MTNFSNQLFQLITSDGGRLAYSLVIGLSVLGAALAAASHWKDADRKTTTRMLLGLVLLLALQGGFAIYSVLVRGGLLAGAEALPVIGWGVTSLSALVLVWLWCCSTATPGQDATVLLTGLLFITGTAFAVVWWTGLPAAISFNGSLVDRLFALVSTALLAVGVFLQLSRRPSVWLAGAVSLSVMAAGFTLHLLFPSVPGDFPAALRYAQIIAYPFLFFLPLRLTAAPAAGTLAAARTGEGLTAGSREAQPGTLSVAEQVIDLLSASTPDAAGQLLARFLCSVMSAETCLLVVSPDGVLRIPGGYSVLGVDVPPGMVLYPEQFPLVSQAITAGKVLRLSGGGQTDELSRLTGFYELSPPQHLLAAPAVSGEGHLSGGFILLRSGLERSWSDQDGEKLTGIGRQLARFLHLNIQVDSQPVSLVSMRSAAPESRLQETNRLLETNHRLVEIRSYITLIRLIGEQVRVQGELIDQLVEEEIAPQEIAELKSANDKMRELVDMTGSLDQVREGLSAGDELRLAKEQVAVLEAALLEAQDTTLRLKAGLSPAELASQRSDIVASAQELKKSAAAIVEYAHFLLGEAFADLQPIQSRILGQIQDAAARMEATAGKIIHQAAGTGPPAPLQVEEVELAALVSKALAATEPLFKEKAIRVTLDSHPDLEPCYANRESVRLLLMNLFQQLAAVMPLRGHARIEIKATDQGDDPGFMIRVSGGVDAGAAGEGLPGFLEDASGDHQPDASGVPGGIPREGFHVLGTLVEDLHGRLRFVDHSVQGGRIEIYLPAGQPENGVQQLEQEQP